jgi:hypothetical protein
MGTKEREEVQAKDIGTTFKEIILENFPNLEKDRPTQVQEVTRTPNQYYQSRTFPLHTVVKTIITENKERIVKALRKKYQIRYKGKPIKITVAFSTETLKQEGHGMMYFKT